MTQYLPLSGKYWLLCILITLCGESYSQIAVAYGKSLSQDNTSLQDNNQISLNEVISILANDYNVKINYDTEELKGKQVEVQLIKSLDGDLEVKLEKLLKPFKLKFEKFGKDSFAIFSDRSSSDIKKIETTSTFPQESQGLETIPNISPDFASGIIQRRDLTFGGKVTSGTGEVLPGVSVIVKGTTMGTVTDKDGVYSLTVRENNSTLVFSFIGFVSEEVSVDGRSVIDVTLLQDIAGLQEVVVIGYGTQTKKDITGSVVAISQKDFNPGQITTPEQLIMGKVPGVQITSNSGAPGAGSQIRIRGGSSLNASNDPLIVIDGVPLDNDKIVGSANPLTLINPNDIESFNILKDASATAIYGSRASNGVIIITTKKGKAGDKFNIAFSTIGSVSQLTKKLDVLTGDEYRDAVNQYATQANKALLGNGDTDWQDEIYRQAFTHDHNLSVSGSYKSLPYRISVGYMDQQGVIITSNVKRTSGAINLNPTFFKDHLKVNLNVKGIVTNNRFTQEAAIGSAASFDPTQPVYADNEYGGYYEWLQADGTPIALAPRNPVSTLKQRDDRSTVQRSIGNLQLDYKFYFLPELKANLNLGYDISESDGNTYQPQTMAAVAVQGGSKLEYAQSKSNNLLDFYLNYVKELKEIESKIDITAGYSYQNFISEDPSYPTLNYEGDTILQPRPIRLQNVLISTFGRLNYTFKDRYILTATVRRDGSSRFSENNRWGTFPSLALAWRIIDEPFMQTLKVFSDLKLRASYGVTGQQDLGANSRGYYPYLARYVESNNEGSYQLGNQFYNTLRPQGYDMDIKWEETATFNVGLDYGFFNGRVYGSLEYYFRRTKDLLAEVPVPGGANLTNRIFTNVGEIENRGVEGAINISVIEKNDIRWTVGANVTYNKGEVTSLSRMRNDESVGTLAGAEIAGGRGNYIQIHSVGYRPFSFYVYKQVYNEQGKPVQGLYADLNEDGVLSSEDMYRYHNPQSNVLLGFNSQFAYKNFSAGFVLRVSLGNYLYNNRNANAYYTNISQSGWLITVPSSVKENGFTGNDANQIFSDHFIENASFLRMDNINLGYNMGNIINDKLNLRLNASCQNVFVITKYTGLDPEIPTGIDNTFYPRPRTYSLGLNLTF